jgi:hypothetical protein
VKGEDNSNSKGDDGKLPQHLPISFHVDHALGSPSKKLMPTVPLNQTSITEHEAKVKDAQAKYYGSGEDFNEAEEQLKREDAQSRASKYMSNVLRQAYGLNNGSGVNEWLEETEFWEV